MDERVYRRLTWGCSCGHVSRSATAEARHRHVFPMLCRRPRGPAISSKRTDPLELADQLSKLTEETLTHG